MLCTLPVLFTMLSNHYGFLYQAKYNWVVLVAIMLGGALIRTSFVLRHKALAFGKAVPWQYAAFGTVVLAGVVFALLPAPQAAATASAAPVKFADVQPVIAQRCQMCHNEQMQSKNVRLDSAAEISSATSCGESLSARPTISGTAMAPAYITSTCWKPSAASRGVGRRSSTGWTVLVSVIECLHSVKRRRSLACSSAVDLFSRQGRHCSGAPALNQVPISARSASVI